MLTEGQEDGMVGIQEGGAAQTVGRRGRLKDQEGGSHNVVNKFPDVRQGSAEIDPAGIFS